MAGGGTAGHVYPGLALAAVLRRRGHEVTFVGTRTGPEARLVPAAGFELRAVRAAPLPRRLSTQSLRAPLVALGAIRQAVPLVEGASVLVGTGGYVSVPAALAARRRRVPVLLHEQNALPGLANRALARVAVAVALAFPEARRHLPRRVRAEVTGNPVREEIVRVGEDREALAKEGRVELGLDEGRRTVLVFGGSQGALHIDRAAVGACRLLEGKADLQVVLVTGPAHLPAMEQAVATTRGGLRVRMLGYLDRMELAYACADLVVCRAGATTIAEVTACGLPALLIPYPHATGGHQEANARAVQDRGGAEVVRNDLLTAEVLAERIEGLVGHDERLRAMAGHAARAGAPDAALRLADLVESVARIEA